MSTDVHRQQGPFKTPLQPGEWFRRRAAGVVLHVTALPGKHGGRLGPRAHRFVDFLSRAGVSVWQTLPLGPVNDSLSPYQPLSMLAGNPALIAVEPLVADGLLSPDTDPDTPAMEACRRAFETLGHAGTHALLEHFNEFRERERDWLEDHSLFMVLHRQYAEPDWTRWPEPLRLREPSAMAEARGLFAEEIALENFMQWQFRRQWQHLRHHANLAGVRLFGDLPIYPALHSADVWLEPELFRLDRNGRPLAVGGTPPDAFTSEGQSWGTPLYDWDAHVAQRFRWWLARMRARLGRYDLLRIDHFRGLAACWSIPIDAASPAEGSWQPVPGTMLLQTLADELPDLELVVEDLGHITEDVHALRNAFGLPGMHVLQFAFDGEAENPHLPENVIAWSVYYSGTHDNDTLRGWWDKLDHAERQRVRSRFAGIAQSDVTTSLLETVFDSRAGLAVAPLQDLLGLGSEARFNTPGTAWGNWRWQLPEGCLDDSFAFRTRRLLEKTDRVA